jgi:hypothetical protein
MNIKTATKKELRQADIDAVQRKADFENFETQLKTAQEKQLVAVKNILKDLDIHMDKATAVYSKILNHKELRKNQDLLDKAFDACDEIQKSRMVAQNKIMFLIMQIDNTKDYKEYGFNRDVDSQADEVDALLSCFGGEE